MGPKNNKPIGRKVVIRLNKDNIFESFVHLDGFSIHGVEKVELIATSDPSKPPKLILTLHPDLVEVEGHADLEAFLDIEKKYDRFDNLDMDD